MPDTGCPKQCPLCRIRQALADNPAPARCDAVNGTSSPGPQKKAAAVPVRWTRLERRREGSDA